MWTTTRYRLARYQNSSFWPRFAHVSVNVNNMGHYPLSTNGSVGALPLGSQSSIGT